MAQTRLAVNDVGGSDLDHQVGVDGLNGLFAFHAGGGHVGQRSLAQNPVSVHAVFREHGAGVITNADQFKVQAHIPEDLLLAIQDINHAMADDAVAHQGNLNVSHTHTASASIGSITSSFFSVPTSRRMANAF